MTSSMLASIPNFHSPNPQHPSLDIVVGWNSKRAYYIYQRDFALPPTHDPKKRCSYTITYLPSNTHTKHPNEVPSPHWTLIEFLLKPKQHPLPYFENKDLLHKPLSLYLSTTSIYLKKASLKSLMFLMANPLPFRITYLILFDPHYPSSTLISPIPQKLLLKTHQFPNRKEKKRREEITKLTRVILPQKDKVHCFHLANLLHNFLMIGTHAISFLRLTPMKMPR